MLKHMLLSIFILRVNAVRDPASRQLETYKKQNHGHKTIETAFGTPVDDILNSLSVGPRGPVLFQDTILQEVITKFVREHIPQRVSQGKGAGAHGYFVVTNDITMYTKAALFKTVGEKTRITVRFSLMSSEYGTPDTIRGRRGFAIKFFTKQGIWDLVGANTPTFFTRDGMMHVQFVHSQNRNPVTNLRDENMIWDFFSLHPESTVEVMSLFGEGGIPDGYRHMNGYGVNVFKMVDKNGNVVYVKFHCLTDQGAKHLSAETAANLTGTNPDYATSDLYNSIANEKFPSWTLHIQVMNMKEAERYHHNPFDSSREWSKDKFPLIEVGKIILNKNPTDYFAEIEQLAFNPANLVPGIEPSPDKLLQGRLIVYGDAQRYRLGISHLQLPANCPFEDEVTNYQRNGQGIFDNQDGAPTYYPNSFNGPKNVPNAANSIFHISGDVARYNATTLNNMDMAADMWNSLDEEQKVSLVENIVKSLSRATSFIQERELKLFRLVNTEFAKLVLNGLRDE